MRKIIPFLLAVLLAVSMGAPISAAAPGPVSVTVEPGQINNASKLYETTTTKDAATAAAFEELFASAKKGNPVQEYNDRGIYIDIAPLLAVKLAYANGRETEYDIYQIRKDLIGAYSNAGSYILDSEKFYSLVDGVGYGFYKLRPVPRVTAGGRALGVSQSSYAFKKLDGKFYRSQYTQTAAPVFTGGGFPELSFDMEPETVFVEAYLRGAGNDGEDEDYSYPPGTAWTGSFEDVPASPGRPGVYDVSLTVYYDNESAHGGVSYHYVLNTGVGTQTSVSLTNDSTYPGELVILRASNVPEGASVSATTGVSFTPQFFEESSGEWIALLPVSCYVQPGKHTVNVKVGGQTYAQTVTVNGKQFERQDLTVPPATADETINSQKANTEYEQYIAPLRTMADSTRWWSGRFIWPVKAQWRRTTQFGMLRYTNGSTTPSIHAALDMAAPAGTPVYATGSGRVLFSGFLQLTGNTIVIEHGYGLKSWYYHLNSLDVKTGDTVRQDRQIGTVGSTGFSTGAHLHFAMSVGSPHSGQFFVNPETLITTAIAE